MRLCVSLCVCVLAREFDVRCKVEAMVKIQLVVLLKLVLFLTWHNAIADALQVTASSTKYSLTIAYKHHGNGIR